MDYKTQIKMFKHLIPIGERDSKDLIDYLKNKFDIVLINPNLVLKKEGIRNYPLALFFIYENH